MGAQNYYLRKEVISLRLEPPEGDIIRVPMGAQNYYLRKEVISLKLESPEGILSESPWGHKNCRMAVFLFKTGAPQRACEKILVNLKKGQ
jgi:hypothetical protein